MTFKYWARTTGRVKKMGKAKRGADAADTERSFSFSLSIVSGRHPLRLISQHLPVVYLTAEGWAP